MRTIREAWEQVLRLKEEAKLSSGGSRDLNAVYNDGESFVTTMLAAHGLGKEAMDELVDIADANARASVDGLLRLSEPVLLDAALAARVGDAAHPRATLELIMLMTMHSSGFTNGLALGLELGKHD